MRAQFLLDLALHRAQLAERVEIEVAPVDEMFELRNQAAAQFEIARCRPRPQQGRALPGLAEVLIEAERAIDRSHQRRVFAARPESQVDAETIRRKQLGQKLAKVRGKLLRGARIGRVEKVDQVEVRAQVQLVHPELAHREHAEVAGGLRARAHDLRRDLKRARDTKVGEPRHQAHRARHAGLANQVRDRDPGEIGALEIRQSNRRTLAIVDAANVQDYRFQQSAFAGLARGGKAVEPFGAHRGQPARDQFGSCRDRRPGRRPSRDWTGRA